MQRFKAYDLETVPLPEDDYTAAQRRRAIKEYHRIKHDVELSTQEAGRMARSLHACLARVCCISVAEWTGASIADGPDRVVVAYTWFAPAPQDEETMLRTFWSDMDAYTPPGSSMPAFVSFNGKGFDAPFLMARSLRHQLVMPPVAARMLDRHRWQNHPHYDLSGVVGARTSLTDLCELLGIERAAEEITGAQIEEAVLAGRMDVVARRCESDARDALRCHDQIVRLAPFAGTQR